MSKINSSEPIKKAITGFDNTDSAPPIYIIYHDGSVKVTNQRLNEDIIIFIPAEDMELIIKAIKK